jgi:hypothetical protein
MFDFIRYCLNLGPVGVPDPVPGEQWVFVRRTRPGDPWPAEDAGYLPVLILDVKDGWVRYGGGCIIKDERAKRCDFMRQYRKVVQP